MRTVKNFSENTFIQSYVKVLYRQLNINDHFMETDFFGAEINKKLSKQQTWSFKKHFESWYFINRAFDSNYD